ncbi:hypothetical protein [Streptomyces sp. NPDC051636]|uniref:hypothetical protein n=1 Tax=Streptomyces sp. NPDC051636 TaxID=3365663 RepID=UPI0037AB6E4E
MGIHTTPRHTRGISLPPGTILGYRADGRPIHVIAGGAEPDDDGPDIEVPDEEPEGEPEPADDGEPESDSTPKPKPPKKDDDKADDFKPPSKDEWARTQAALRKANEDAKRHRLRNKELEEKARGDETEHEKQLREAREEGEKRYRTPLVRTAVRGALVEAGALAFLQDEKDPKAEDTVKKGESRLSRLMKLVDLDALDVDEDGSVSGLESAVADVIRDFPDLFATAPRKPKPRPTGAPRPAAVEKPKSTAELHAARLLGKA